MPTISRNKEIRNPAKIGENQELNVFPVIKYAREIRLSVIYASFVILFYVGFYNRMINYLTL